MMARREAMMARRDEMMAGRDEMMATTGRGGLGGGRGTGGGRMSIMCKYSCRSGGTAISSVCLQALGQVAVRSEDSVLAMRFN